jgi:RNA polymerase sigma factor (sigma-70 family)
MPLADMEKLAEQQTAEPNDSDDFQLQRAFSQLPDAYREIILLRFYANQSCQQIARNLNMPVGSVTKTLSRAYAQLRQLLEQQKAKENEVSK